MQSAFKLIGPSFLSAFIFSACLPQSCTLNKSSAKSYFQLSTGERVDVEVVRSDADKERGLSGRQASDFSESQAMLFLYLDLGPRRFWMPDTYFDLDIFFLDKDWLILDVERNVPHHPGRQNPESIPTTRMIYAQHVLEMKASSPLSKKLQPGQKLLWGSEAPL